MNTTTEPQRAPEIEAPENPDVIKLTVSEVDRQTAGPYFGGLDCLVCTVLRNNGFNVESIGGHYATVDGTRYDLLEDGGAARYSEEPAWPRAVVGRAVTLYKRFTQE